MDFVAVFSFFSENIALTPQQRLAELICVAVLFLLLAATLAVLLTRKIKNYRAETAKQTEKTNADTEK